MAAESVHVASWARHVVAVTVTEDIAAVAGDGPVRNSSTVARLGTSTTGSNSFSISVDGRRGLRWLREEALRLGKKLGRWPGWNLLVHMDHRRGLSGDGVEEGVDVVG